MTEKYTVIETIEDKEWVIVFGERMVQEYASPCYSACNLLNEETAPLLARIAELEAAQARMTLYAQNALTHLQHYTGDNARKLAIMNLEDALKAPDHD